MPTAFTPRGSLGRVRSISSDGYFLNVEFKNGSFSILELDDAIQSFSIGDIILIDNDGTVDAAPSDLWQDTLWIGTVKALIDNKAVVDRNGVLVTVDVAHIDIAEGNTVEVDDFVGIRRILLDSPIRRLDFSPEPLSIERYRTLPQDLTSETFDDFGGFGEAIERARELVDLPLRRHAELTAIGARPIRGVLFAGPPGTGKTKLARIVANYAEASFYYIDGPGIFAPLVGQSEELLRNIFEDAARQPRAIIFIDELDGLASSRESDMHESSRRILAQLLTLMDGFKRTENVVVIAATNRPGDIDSALRRPGRFDWEVSFGLPVTKEREDILIKSSRHLRTEGELPHSSVADLTPDWSPAELTAIWTEAALFAADDGRSAIMAEDYLAGFTRVAEQRGTYSS